MVKLLALHFDVHPQNLFDPSTARSAFHSVNISYPSTQDHKQPPQEKFMRFYFVVLLVAAALLTSTDALSTSEQSKTTTHDILFEKNDASRLLRKRSTTDVDDEERSFSVAALSKRFGGKLKRLTKYNKWIFSGKKPTDIKDPRYEGYWNFYHNRMTPGGKYL